MPVQRRCVNTAAQVRSTQTAACFAGARGSQRLRRRKIGWFVFNAFKAPFPPARFEVTFCDFGEHFPGRTRNSPRRCAAQNTPPDSWASRALAPLAAIYTPRVVCLRIWIPFKVRRFSRRLRRNPTPGASQGRGPREEQQPPPKKAKSSLATSLLRRVQVRGEGASLRLGRSEKGGGLLS